MYKFKIGENARKQQGICPMCSPERNDVPWRELTEWGMCGTCYAETLHKGFIDLLRYQGMSEKEAHEYIRDLVDEHLDKHKVKREKTRPGWLPGME